MIYIISFFSSLLSSLYILPIVKKIGLKYNFFDNFDERKLNHNRKIRIGGLGIIVSFLFALLISYFIDPYYFSLINNLHFKSIVIGSLIIFLIGLIDDIKSLSPWTRLVTQIIISIYIWISGIRIDIFNIFFFKNLIFTDDIVIFFSFIVTIIWIVGIVNAINWLDGLDGLASGISIIYLIFIFLCGLINSNFIILLMSSALIGSNLGFLKYNFKPAKIIMGDGGSYFNGFLISILGLISTSNLNNENNLTVLLILLSIPIIDMIYVIFSRLNSFKSPFYPDRRHIHQRLIDSGIDEINTLYIIYFLAVSSGFISFLLFLKGN